MACFWLLIDLYGACFVKLGLVLFADGGLCLVL